MRFVEAGALVRHRRARKIVEKKSDEIEHGRRFENHRPAAGRGFARLARGGAFSLALRAIAAGSICLRSGELALAQPEESDSRMVIENSARVWRCDAKRPRVLAIADCVTPVEKIPAAVCLFFSAISRDAGDGAGAIGRRGMRRILKIARDLGVFLRAGHGQQIGIARLAARERLRGFDHAAQRIVVGLVGGRARGAAVEHGSHRDGEHLLRDVLMNRVVGEARQRVRDHADFDFGFVRVAEFEDSFRDAAHLGVGKQMQAGHSRAGFAVRGESAISSPDFYDSRS